MRKIDKKITFGVLVGTRAFFNPLLVAEQRKKIISKIQALGYNSVILDVTDTPNGAVESLADAKKYAKLFCENRDIIDGVIVILPNFGDELGIVQTLDMAKLNVPVLVQACNDEIDKVDVKNRRDAFCGKLSVCNNLYQYGIKFTDTTTHTSDIDSDLFANDINRFANICRTVNGLRSARIGAIGARPAPFQTTRFSEKLLQTTGITVVTVDLSEIIGAATKFDDSATEIAKKLEAIQNYGHIPKSINHKNILKQAKLSVAIDNWMAENECDASAIQCWESVQNNYGCATCLSMSMMGENLSPSACEVDVAGAVSMYTLLLASGKAPGFLDWNNNFGNDTNMCVCTHCSNYPKSFMGQEIEISNLDILGETLGRENCFGAIKGHVVKGPLTYFRISTDDTKGCIKSYLGQGDFTDDEFNMDGGIAVCRIPNLQKLLKYMCQEGFEHHVAMVRGSWAEIVDEAVSKYLSWNLYNHNE
ncbi:fucose isomerase [bacterium]|nr:fucose isomerase [bacterium]